jgi:hypothetical protein
MYIIIWEYQVKANRVAEFENIYATNGAWAKLFQKSAGFLGIEDTLAIEHPDEIAYMLVNAGAPRYVLVILASMIGLAATFYW